MSKDGGIYVHIPYCANKCIYCDFYSAGNRIAEWENYVFAVTQEFKERKYELNYNPSTLYFGGGTPSLLPPKSFKFLVDKIEEIVEKDNWEEFTIEINPENVTTENIKIWKECGVNRVSLGIQSFNDKELKLLGRKHNSKVAENAAKLLRDNFNNLSLDIMFGLPGQTLKSYDETLSRVLSLSPDHISSYSLMLEEGTALTLLEKQGKIILPDESEWIKMFEITTDKLASGNIFRYELSNYSLTGKESRHNSNYWRGLPYIGLGTSAHSYDGIRIRKENPGDLKGYINRFHNPGKDSSFDSITANKKFYVEELLSETELREEMIMTRLRMVEGLNLNEFSLKFGEKEMKEVMKKARKYLNSGLLKDSQGNLSFTDKGFLTSDSILSDLI